MIRPKNFKINMKILLLGREMSKDIFSAVPCLSQSDPRVFRVLVRGFNVL